MAHFLTQKGAGTEWRAEFTRSGLDKNLRQHIQSPSFSRSVEHVHKKNQRFPPTRHIYLSFEGKINDYVEIPSMGNSGRYPQIPFDMIRDKLEYYTVPICYLLSPISDKEKVMLHAPTSESKQRSGPARTKVETQREHEVHPRLGESAQREHFAGLQSTIGNQAVIRMLAAPKLQQTAGNQGVLRRLPPISHTGAPVAVQRKCAACEEEDKSTVPLNIQPKLNIGAVDDPLEREADAVADLVMSMPDQGMAVAPVALGTFSNLQRKCACGGTCAECQAEQLGQGHKALQTKSTSPGAQVGAPAPPIVHEVLRSPGQPLDSATRAFMEPHFGQDFGHVRVHSGQRAAQSAREVGALAYTVGRDVVLGQTYMPGHSAGKRLLAHELAHVVQQTGSAPAIQRQPQPKEDRYIPPSAKAGRLVYAEEIFQQSPVRPLRDANFTNIFYDRDKVIVVDFWASWCRPCDDAAAHIDYLARRYASGPYAARVKFYHVQLEDSVNPQLNKRFGLDSFPVVYFYYTGTGRQPSPQAPLLEGSINSGEAQVEDYEWRIQAILRRHGFLVESKGNDQQVTAFPATPAVQRMAFGTDTPPEFESGTVTAVSAAEMPRIRAAIRKLEEVAHDPFGFEKCHKYFAEHCPNGNEHSLENTFDKALLWKALHDDGNGASTLAGTEHIAIRPLGYREGAEKLAGYLMHELLHSCGLTGEEKHHLADVARLYCMGGGRNRFSALTNAKLDDAAYVLLGYRRFVGEWASGRLQPSVGADLNIGGLKTGELVALTAGLTGRTNLLWGGERFGGLTLTPEAGLSLGRFRTPKGDEGAGLSGHGAIVLQLKIGAEFAIPHIAGHEGRRSAISLEAAYRIVKPLNPEAEAVHALLFGVSVPF